MQRIQVDSWFGRIAGWIMPPQCLLCRGPGQPPALDLCAECHADLPVLPRPCARCGQARDQSEASGDDCNRCRSRPLPFVRCFAPFEYAPPLDGIIHGLKYDGALANARVLGTLLGRALAALDLHRQADLLVPMPLHTTRLVERGFNQSYEIARFVSRGTLVPCEPRALGRLRATGSQVDLSRTQRTLNVQGAFGRAARSSRVEGRRVALVDDVVTTGSTVIEASRALLTLGAVSVEVWSVGRALQA